MFVDLIQIYSLNTIHTWIVNMCRLHFISSHCIMQIILKKGKLFLCKHCTHCKQLSYGHYYNNTFEYVCKSFSEIHYQSDKCWPVGNCLHQNWRHFVTESFIYLIQRYHLFFTKHSLMVLELADLIHTSNYIIISIL